MRRPVRKLWVRCASAGGELLGMLVVGVDDHAIDGADTRREIAELCDRVSVTLSSADRERRLLERATHDNLTGLANRAGLYESIDARLAEDSPEPFSVLFVDLDRFEVNDCWGIRSAMSCCGPSPGRLETACRRTLLARQEATSSWWWCAGRAARR
jgi:predicted signal transduction protein with EAL and GGDEF domain